MSADILQQHKQTSVSLLLSIDALLTTIKEEANALLASARYKEAVDKYQSGISWFETLQKRAVNAAAGVGGGDDDAGAAPSETTAAAVEEIDDAVSDHGASELASRVLFHFRHTFCPPAKPAGFIFSTEDPCVRALVTVVNADTEGLLTLATCTRRWAATPTDENPSVASEAIIGPSILLTLMALRSNKAMAQVKYCEMVKMPTDVPMLTTAAASSSAKAEEEEKVETEAKKASDTERVVSAVVKSGLVSALTEAVAEAEGFADSCEKIASFVKTILVEESGKEEARRKSSSFTPLSPALASYFKTLTTVYTQALTLAMKCSSRSARLLAMLADTEELQLLAYFGASAGAASVVGKGSPSSSSSPPSSPSAAAAHLISKAAVMSANRRYKFLIKAWQHVREMKQKMRTNHFDSLPKHLILSSTTAVSDEGAASPFLIDMGPAITALTYLKTTDEGKYKGLVEGIQQQQQQQQQGAAGGGGDGKGLHPHIAPFISKVHGIGMASTGPIEDGDCLLYEVPLIKVSGGSFESRFASAVSQLKGMVVKGRKDLDAWWGRIVSEKEKRRRQKNDEATSDGKEAAHQEATEVTASDVLPSLSNAFCSNNASFALPLPASVYQLFSLLALHCDVDKDAALFDAGDDNEGGGEALSIEDLALCSLWHNNAMRITEVDFRIGSHQSHQLGGQGGAIGDEVSSGLFVTGSRFNHSIRRINAVCIFDMVSGHLKVRALTKIPAGKEIFISYAPLIDSFINQKKHLRFDVVREMRRRPVFNTEDGSAPEGKAVADADLLEDEQETGEDVLAPHLFGQELITCPMCMIEIEGKRTSPDVQSIRCFTCGRELPIADYYASVAQRREAAVKLCNDTSNGGDVGANRAKAVRMLLGIEDGATMLDKHHFLRSQIRMECLAAAAGASLSEELSARLVHLSRLTAEQITGLCPPSWPLTTGLKMHYVYCVGRHRIGIGRQCENDFVGLVARESKLDPNRKSIKFEDEAPPQYSPDLVKEDVDYVNRRLLRFMFLSMQEHVLQYGAEGAMQSFMERYRPELESVGVSNAESLERCIKMAAIIVCR